MNDPGDLQTEHKKTLQGVPVNASVKHLRNLPFSMHNGTYHFILIFNCFPLLSSKLDYTIIL